MTWSNRIRLFFGLIVVLAIVLGATLILSQRETQIASKSASIKAISYSVGSDYAGTVIAEKVNVGDTVKKGQPLMTIQSGTLLTDLKSKAGVPENAAYRTSTTGTLTLLATEPGVVSRMGAQVGGFVTSGSRVASVDRAGSLYVLADFVLDPYDYSRIEKGAKVDLTLPNQQRLVGTVSQIQVKTAHGRADVRIKVRSSQLVRGRQDGLDAPGTPISANLHLRDNGPLAGLKENFLSLLGQIGL